MSHEPRRRPHAVDPEVRAGGDQSHRRLQRRRQRPDDPGFIFAVPEADAIVNAGCRDQDARGELTVPMRYLHGAIDPMGHFRLTVRFE
jgi:hypothetical protein